MTARAAALARGTVLAAGAALAGDALDHVATRKAAKDAVRLAGATPDPLRGVEPYATRFITVDFPTDVFLFHLGCDGKVYADTASAPKGPRRTLVVELTLDASGGTAEWIGTASVLRRRGTGYEVESVGGSGGDAEALLPTDQGRGFETILRNLRRWNQFKARDPATAARAAVRDLQNQGHLHDAVRPLRLTAAEARTALTALLAAYDDRTATTEALYRLPGAARTLEEVFRRGGVSGPRLPEYARLLAGLSTTPGWRAAPISTTGTAPRSWRRSTSWPTGAPSSAPRSSGSSGMSRTGWSASGPWTGSSRP